MTLGEREGGKGGGSRTPSVEMISPNPHPRTNAIMDMNCDEQPWQTDLFVYLP